MRKIHWLHYSDIHLNDTGVETNRLRQKLPEYLRNLNIHCDYAFFTGDIRRARLGDFPANAADYLRQVAQSVNVPKDRIFMVPGNHDLDRTSEGRQEAVQKIWKAVEWSGYYDFSRGRIEEEDVKIISKGQSGFRSIISDLYQDEERCALYEKPCFCITTDELNIVHLDSTITQGDDQDRDFVVGTEALQNVLQNVDTNKPTVLLTHYSFDYLHRNEQNILAPLLQDYGVQLWIAGHEHEHLCRKQRDYFYELQTGNIVNENGALSCVLVGTLDLNTGEGSVRCHAYYPRGGWAEYPFIRIGYDDNAVYPFRIALPRQSYNLDASLEEMHAMEQNILLESNGGLFHQVEIRPELITDLSWNADVFQGDAQSASLKKVLVALWRKKQEFSTESCHALLLGDGGMGKSTMLFHTCKELLSEHQLTVFASLQMLQGMEKSLENHMLYCLYRAEGLTEKQKFQRLIGEQSSKPGIILFVDGFNELNSDRSYQYARELKNLALYPGIQIVISSRLDFLRNYGMSHFQMLRTCELRDEQIQALFSIEEWNDIVKKRHLHILLRNPMMALLYAQTSPVMEKYQDLNFCNWKIPVENASDILHNFYMAQTALTLERGGDGHEICMSLCVTHYILPYLAYRAEKDNVMGWDDSTFEEIFADALQDGNENIFGTQLPEAIRKIKRMYGLNLGNMLPEDEIYQLIINRLCLLRTHNQLLSFQHQIYRDYLAAVYLFEKLCKDTQNELWTGTVIQTGVVQYLRHMPKALWGEQGFVTEKLDPYRNKRIEDENYYVQNMLQCWLTEERDFEGERNLSGLDLRNTSLADALKEEYKGTICIDRCKIKKSTFVNEKRHDRIVGLAFSHDHRTLAAVSENGLVSVSNLLTQSQMIIGNVTLESKVCLGFSAEDYLVLQTGAHCFKWPTIAYDRMIEIDKNEILEATTYQEGSNAEKLYQLLRDSNLLGSCYMVSENQQWLAVGFENGHLQVWNTETQVIAAELSLGDSQVVSAAFSPNGELLAMTAGGPLVQIWNVKGQRTVRNLRFTRPIRKVRFPATLDFSQRPLLECEASNGTFVQINLANLKNEQHKNNQHFLKIQKNIRKQLEGKPICKLDMANNGNAVIQVKNSMCFYVWNHETGEMNTCSGHTQQIKDVAICKADPRYAASYSDERIHAKGTAKHLNGQKVVRVWAVRKGNCMQRLSTNQRTIKKLQFFTTNRIILAGFATNGDIILWELHNRKVRGEEWGHWDPISIVTKSPAEPLECAVSTEAERFIGVYDDGTVFSRSFSGKDDARFKVFPGIDLTAVRWNVLEGDADVISALECHRNY